MYKQLIHVFSGNCKCIQYKFNKIEIISITLSEIEQKRKDYLVDILKLIYAFDLTGLI